MLAGPKMSRFPPLPTRIFKVSTEVSPGFSDVHHPSGRSNTCSHKAGSLMLLLAWEWGGDRTYAPRSRGEVGA